MTSLLPILTATNISKVFPTKATSVTVLEDINLKLYDRDFLIITGPSGCGKSTLLHVLLGLETPSTGNILIQNKNLYRDYTEDERTILRKNTIGMVYQQPNWIRSLTVLENIMFALRLKGKGVEEANRRASDVLNMVNMTKWQDYWPTELSSGQQQKVAVARAVVTNPDIIVADEPTGNLDFNSGQEIMELLRSLNHEGKTIVMVTHDLEYLKYGTRSIVMFDGHITKEQNNAEFTHNIKKSKRGILDNSQN